MTIKTDPVITAYLRSVKNESYEKWIDNAFWKFIREACSNKKSVEYKAITSFLETKIHDEAYMCADIGSITFGKSSKR